MTLPTLAVQFPAFRFAQPWSLQASADFSDLESWARYDERLLRQVMQGRAGPCIAIRRAPRCLVASRRESRMPNFLLASEALAAAGWPVVVRSSGGSCVPQDSGVLNLSLVHPGLKGWSLEDGYRLLVELLTRFLCGYGLEALTGEVPGAFCDGRFNLQVGGRKLVGTAQRWSGGSRNRSAVLAHACLLVDLDLVEATEQANNFYRLCGYPQRFDPLACTTLRECLGREPLKTFVEEVEQRLIAVVAESFGIQAVIK